MTLPTEVCRNQYAGAGSPGPFAFNFRIFAESDLVVIRRSATGVDTALTLTTDYTVTGVGNAAGTVTLVDDLETGEVLSIRRVRPVTQARSVRNQAAYAAATHEDAWDDLVMKAQQQADDAARSFKLPGSYDGNGISLEVRPETGKVLAWQSETELGNSTLDSSSVALPGAGRTVATLSAYLLNNAVANVKDFGAVGDDSANDTAAFGLALGSGKKLVYIPSGTYLLTAALTVPANVTVIGEGDASVLHFVTPGVSFHELTLNSGARVRDFKVYDINGATSVFHIIGDNVVAERIFIEGDMSIGSSFLIKTADGVRIDGCHFKKCGYGVLQEYGFSSNKVHVVNCYFESMQADAVECNVGSTVGVTANDWVIANNIFAGTDHFPTVGGLDNTECRFIGLTQIGRVIIANNIIENVLGDAPIHLEEAQSDVTIIGNIFRNCAGSGGNSGYIYILNSAKRTIIVGNTFVHDDTSLMSMYALGMSGVALSGPVLFANNRLQGNASRTLGVITAASGQSSVLTIANNQGSGLGDVFAALVSCLNVTMTGNDWECANGLVGSGVINWTVSNNVWRATTAAINLTAPQRLVLTNNNFVSGTVGYTSPVTCLVQNNLLSDGTILSDYPASFDGTRNRIAIADGSSISFAQAGGTLAVYVVGSGLAALYLVGLIRRATDEDIPWLLEQLQAFSDFYGTKRPLMPADPDVAAAVIRSLIASTEFFIADLPESARSASSPASSRRTSSIPSSASWRSSSGGSCRNIAARPPARDSSSTSPRSGGSMPTG
jgi:hypothetical protein